MRRPAMTVQRIDTLDRLVGAAESCCFAMSKAERRDVRRARKFIQQMKEWKLLRVAAERYAQGKPPKGRKPAGFAKVEVAA